MRALAGALAILDAGHFRAPFDNNAQSCRPRRICLRPPGTSRPRRETTATGRFPDFPDLRACRRLLGTKPNGIMAMRSPVTVAGAVPDRMVCRHRRTSRLSPFGHPLRAHRYAKSPPCATIRTCSVRNAPLRAAPSDRFPERGSKGNGVQNPGCPCNCKRRADRPIRHWDFIVLRRRPDRP